ncbi:MAG: hypothetical protein SVV80_12875, partial [Planctomycetota bacterium]|nr:hypothetical protein [Planctomycetota bacterium]
MPTGIKVAAGLRLAAAFRLMRCSGPRRWYIFAFNSSERVSRRSRGDYSRTFARREDTLAMVQQVRAHGAPAVNGAFVGNYMYYPGASDRSNPYP